eukprot:6212245-Pleurochrysis_carterae.AAC.2
MGMARLLQIVAAVSSVTTSAEKTLATLMNHVLTTYTFQMVIQSDNGTAFRNELTSKFAEYAGLRSHAIVLRILTMHLLMAWPNNRWRASLAYQFATRNNFGIGLTHYLWWHLLLTLPITCLPLESPSLSGVREKGNEFVETFATRLRQAWLLAVRDTSESIRLDAAACSDAYHRRWLKPNTMDSVGGIQVGDRVLLRHCSIEYATLLKKLGFSPLRSSHAAILAFSWNDRSTCSRTRY